jgi:repressor LexA
MNEPLSPRQKDVLDLIERSIAERGYPPTRPEISAALGATSPNAAEQHLRALERKGYIAILPVARGIKVLVKSAPHLPSGHLLPAARGEERARPSLRTRGEERARPSLRTRGEERARPSLRTRGEERARPSLRMRGEGTAIPSPRAAGRGWRAAPGEGHMLRLPLIGRVAAGQPILAEQSIEDELALDPQLFTPTPDFLLRVRGDSMRDAGIHDGDFVAVARSREATNGQIVVARIDDEATVKTFERKAGRIRLLPANPDYAPIDVDGDLVIEGRVVGVIRRSP